MTYVHVTYDLLLVVVRSVRSLLIVSCIKRRRYRHCVRMFRSTTSNFDKLLDKATSNLRLEPDWPAILQICDLIRQGDVQPKYALAAIKKKLYNANPHIAMFGLQVLESCVKHCGNPIHDEIGTKQYMEQLRDLVKSTSHDDVKNKVLELIQAWAYAFRNSPKYRAVQENISGSPNLQQVVPEDDVDPELARYLNRSYWEQRQSEEAQQHEKQLHHVSDRNGSRVDSPLSQQPSAPMSSTTPSNKLQHRHENGETDTEMEEFVATLKMQVEIFVNRMKSNSSRGRSIANDSSVQTLFMNITAMHSRLLKHIQQQDDSRVYYEELQDKLAQVKDARAALDALREEYREKLRRQAEEAERIRQMQMAHKLEIMRKKKQEYLQYQRQLALQKIQEQER
ncbi:hypothetical protein B7P43_G02735, partial [Cryptotermes secundus]